MKHEENIIILTLSIFSLSALCRVQFDISNFNTRPSDESRIVIFAERSLDHCMEECTRRNSCQAVGYHRLTQLCELASDSTLSSTELGYVMIRRNRMKLHDSKNNTVEAVCDGSQPTDVCSECKPPKPVNNGKYLGNMNQVGLRRAIVCDEGYMEERGQEIIECNNDGEWNYVPVCIRNTEACNFRPSETSENEYQVLDHGKWKDMQCAKGTVYDHSNCRCDWP